MFFTDGKGQEGGSIVRAWLVLGNKAGGKNSETADDSRARAPCTPQREHLSVCDL